MSQETNTKEGHQMTKTLTPPTADRSLKGRIAQKQDLHARLMETANRHGQETPTGSLFAEMADDVAADIAGMQNEGRATK